MTLEKLDKMDRCAHLLEEPAPGVVWELTRELRKYIIAIDKCYNHNEGSRQAVIEHFGLNHDFSLFVGGTKE